MSERGQSMSIRIWDLPTRLFHWALVASIVGSYITAENDELDTHQWFGVFTLSLILFRVAWGIIGSEPSRFSSFVKGPVAVLSYLRALMAGSPPESLGHNPLGALSVVALLLVLFVQGSLGLFATDDILFEGPLYHLVDPETGQRAAGWHEIVFNLLMVLVLLHLAAVAYYRYILKRNLLAAMIVGRMEVEGEPPSPRMRSPWLALLLYLISLGIVLAVINLA